MCSSSTAISIPDGSAVPSTTNGTDFGSADITSGTVTHTFHIYNTGTANLNLTGTPRVEFTGANRADFSIPTQPDSPISSGGYVQFQAVFNPTAEGLRTATINIASNDPDESSYDFAIQGRGTSLGNIPAAFFSSNSYTVHENAGSVSIRLATLTCPPMAPCGYILIKGMVQPMDGTMLGPTGMPTFIHLEKPTWISACRSSMISRVEGDEHFFVWLGDPISCTITTPNIAEVIILDDDGTGTPGDRLAVR